MMLFPVQRRAAVHTANAGAILSENSPFFVQEAYKALRTNVIFSLPGKGCKCIGVTSAERGEGKSTSAVNLALSFGQIGKKVLLIDCDMRLPTVASKLGVPGQPGLSNLLIGACSLDEAVQECGALQVLPAGVLPPDPTGLLESRQMKELLGRLRGVYDYILIDLPPVTAVADAAILSRCVDGFLLVVRHGKTEYRDVSGMLSQLRFANARIIGFLYTGTERGGKRYGRSYKSYGKSDNGGRQ